MKAMPHHSSRAITKIEMLAAIVVLCLAAGFLLPAIGRGRIRESRAICLKHLGTIGRAVGAYLREHEDHWPYIAKLRTFKLHDPAWPTLPKVLRPYMGGTMNVFRCPSDRRVLQSDDPLSKSFSQQTSYYQTEGLSYEWLWSEARGGRKVGQESLSQAKGFGFGRADQRLLSDFEPFHEGDGGGTFNTLFADLAARSSHSQTEASSR